MRLILAYYYKGPHAVHSNRKFEIRNSVDRPSTTFQKIIVQFVLQLKVRTFVPIEELEGKFSSSKSQAREMISFVFILIYN